MFKYCYDVEQIKNIVAESLNFSEVLRKLNIPRRGNNLKTMKNFIIKHDIDFSHFTYEKRTNRNKTRTSVEDYLNNKIPIKSYSLKKILLRNNMIEYKCASCGLTEWNGKPIELQLHHIDGNPMNNNFENLQLLCPNCHSQTENFSSKKERKVEKYKSCPNCGAKILKTSKLCTKCAAEKRLTARLVNLTKEDLLEKFKELKSFTNVGKFYNVSDNAIRKHCKKFGLPISSKEMKELIEKTISLLEHYCKRDLYEQKIVVISFCRS